jgi:hypothetical protein
VAADKWRKRLALFRPGNPLTRFTRRYQGTKKAKQFESKGFSINPIFWRLCAFVRVTLQYLDYPLDKPGPDLLG